MIVIKWFFLAVSSFVMDLLGLLLVPIALLHGGVNNRLPKWAYYWDNDREPFGDTARGPTIAAATGWYKGWLRYLWMGVRNPANNFGYEVAGFKQKVGVAYRLWGDINTSDQGVGGWKLITASVDDSIKAFELYVVVPYSNKTRCLRMRLGWKIDENVRNLGGFKVVSGVPATIVHVINPFMSYTGR